MPSAKEKLTDLRKYLKKNGFDGFVIPNTDEFQGEYIPASAKRLEWLTGFSGSAATVIVLGDKAAFFTDGRYTLQAKDQVDSKLYSIYNSHAMSPQKWIAEHLPKGAMLGYDAWLHTENNAASFENACGKARAKWAAVSSNPIDSLWSDRPAPPMSPLKLHDMKYAGETSASKIERISSPLKEQGIDAVILTAPDSVCWLLNIRGDDVPYTPFSLCFALLFATGKVVLFTHERKVPDAVRKALKDYVTISSLDTLENSLKVLKNKTIQIDGALSASWFFDRLCALSVTIVQAADPCQLPKACKNIVEIKGTRNAHIRDGVAVTGFLCWLDEHVGKEAISEISAAEKLLEFRKKQAHFIYPSFATISGFKGNGAIVHYHPEEHTNKPLTNDGILLIDSGGQYHDGTTDITRTVTLGNPTGEQKNRFTQVLKGHIGLAMAKFPKGTTGSQLDSIARYALWQDGLDYDHGTGHGVGSFLSVHEGPQRISKAPNSTSLQLGMIISNEPGYYKEGEYGIRIENLVTVVSSAHENFLQFDTLTCAPIDIRLVEISLLTDEEKKWLNAYHMFVYKNLSPYIKGETLSWLERRTQPV